MLLIGSHDKVAAIPQRIIGEIEVKIGDMVTVLEYEVEQGLGMVESGQWDDGDQIEWNIAPAEAIEPFDDLRMRCSA